MWNYLESLRTRPDEYKRRFAYVVSGIVTVIIFCVWVWVTFFRAPHQVQNIQASQSQGASAVSAGITSTASATSSWQEIEDVMGRIKKTFNDGVSQLSSEHASTSTTTLPKQGQVESF
jgi:hypothetical protein